MSGEAAWADLVRKEREAEEAMWVAAQTDPDLAQEMGFLSSDHFRRCPPEQGGCEDWDKVALPSEHFQRCAPELGGCGCIYRKTEKACPLCGHELA